MSQSKWLIWLLLNAGFELTFFSGVYGTSVGHTLKFGPVSKQLLGLSGVFIGVGEIIGKVYVIVNMI